MNQQKPLTTGLKLESHTQRMARLTGHRKDLQRQLMNLNLTLALVRAKGSERDWPEDFLHENGLYECYCARCEKNFLGREQRLLCKCCNNAIPTALADAMLGRVRASSPVV
jgi:hypothetical protein